MGVSRKITQTDTTINATSYHPIQYKKAAFKTYIMRKHKLPTLKKEKKKNKKFAIIKQIAINNKYDEEEKDKQQLRTRNRQNTEEMKLTVDKFSTLRYCGNITNKIAKILSKVRIRTAVKVENTLKQLLDNSKDKLEKLDKNGVYDIKCRDCKSVYIGETGRSIKTRIKKHKKDKKYSAMNEFLKGTQHQLDDDHIMILHQERKEPRLTLLEALETKRSQNKNEVTTLNEQINLKFTLFL